MNPLPTPTNTTALANLEDILFNSAGLIALAFISGWAVKKILGWLGNKLTGSPIAKAIITAAGKSLQVLLPAYTVWLLVDHNMVHISVSKQEYFKIGTSLLLSLAHTTTVYHLVLVPIAWAQKFADQTDNKLDDVLVPMISTVIRVAVVLVGTVKAVSIIDSETAKSILALLATGAVAGVQKVVQHLPGQAVVIGQCVHGGADMLGIGLHQVGCGLAMGLGLNV